MTDEFGGHPGQAADDVTQHLLRRLADGRFHSGRELGAALSLSRSAVWKRLKELTRDWDLQLHAVRGRGYRLANPLELLDAKRIAESLSPAARARHPRIEILFCTPSTNARLMTDGAWHSGHVCLAERQTAGRGRRGRRWISPFGSNLYISFGWVFEGGHGSLAGLSLAVGVAVARALDRLGAPGIGLKWPNDLMANGRKLGGVLVELRAESHGPCRAVTGIGINTEALPPDAARRIDQAWTDLHTFTAAPWSRNLLAARLIESVGAAMETFQTQGFAAFRGLWEQLDVLRNQPVEVQTPKGTYMGRALGIDEEGGLRLATAEGVRRFLGGEVSLRAAP